MGVYVDGMVIPVQKKQIAAYIRSSRMFGKVWREHGAIEYRECVGDDVKVGKRTSFPRSVKLKRGEVVCLSWTLYKSRKHRDRVMAKAMKDPRIVSFLNSKKKPPFDMKRLYFGGFKSVVKL